MTKFLKGMDEAYAYMASHDDQQIVDQISKVKAVSTLPPATVLGLVQGAKPYLPYEHGFIGPAAWNSALTSMSKWDVPGFSGSMPEAQYDTAIDMSYLQNAIGKPTSEG